MTQLRKSSHRLTATAWLALLLACICAACDPALPRFEQQLYAFGTIVTLSYSAVDEQQAVAATASAIAIKVVERNSIENFLD